MASPTFLQFDSQTIFCTSEQPLTYYHNNCTSSKSEEAFQSPFCNKSRNFKLEGKALFLANGSPRRPRADACSQCVSPYIRKKQKTDLIIGILIHIWSESQPTVDENFSISCININGKWQQSFNIFVFCILPRAIWLAILCVCIRVFI